MTVEKVTLEALLQELDGEGFKVVRTKRGYALREHKADCVKCQRPMRERGVHKGEAPDTVLRATWDTCGSCYKVDLGIPGRGTGAKHVPTEDRADEIIHLIEGRTPWEGLAERVGLRSWEYLLRWCRERGHRELVGRLRTLRENQGGYEKRGPKREEQGYNMWDIKEDDWW